MNLQSFAYLLATEIHPVGPVCKVISFSVGLTTVKELLAIFAQVFPGEGGERQRKSLIICCSIKRVRYPGFS
jgi:hypothetical protein